MALSTLYKTVDFSTKCQLKEISFSVCCRWQRHFQSYKCESGHSSLNGTAVCTQLTSHWKSSTVEEVFMTDWDDLCFVLGLFVLFSSQKMFSYLDKQCQQELSHDDLDFFQCRGAVNIKNTALFFILLDTFVYVLLSLIVHMCILKWKYLCVYLACVLLCRLERLFVHLTAAWCAVNPGGVLLKRLFYS